MLNSIEYYFACKNYNHVEKISALKHFSNSNQKSTLSRDDIAQQLKGNNMITNLEDRCSTNLLTH